MTPTDLAKTGRDADAVDREREIDPELDALIREEQEAVRRAIDCDDPTHPSDCGCGARPDHEYESRIERRGPR